MVSITDMVLGSAFYNLKGKKMKKAFLALAVLLITAGCAFSQGDEKKLENEHQNIKKVVKKAIFIARIRAIREIVYKQPRINKIWKKCTSNEIFTKIVFETDPILKSTAIDQALNHPGNRELLETCMNIDSMITQETLKLAEEEFIIVLKKFTK